MTGTGHNDTYGGVGTGKTYFAACIANALIAQEVSVRMTNLAAVINCGFENREAMMKDLCAARMLILDDLGMERDTAFALETVYELIDRRVQSAKPLIVTTNLSLEALKNPPDLDRARIYDRVRGATKPLLFTGRSLRANHAKEISEKLSTIWNG